MRVSALELCDTTQRRRPDDRSCRQLIDRQAGVFGVQQQCVARVVSRRDGANDAAIRQARRHVLERVDRDIDVATQQGVLELLREQALVADLGERHVQHLVAHGLDRHDGRIELRQLGSQRIAHKVRLPHGEARLTRANDERLPRCVGHGSLSSESEMREK